MTQENWILESIKPKSDQLNADDLISGPIDITIEDVKRCSDEKQPVAIVIGEGRQPYKPCKSMRRVLVSLWGDNPRKWVGQRLRLFCDPSVMFGGLQVGGIRISHASIDVAKEVLLTTAKAKRSAFTVQPLPKIEPPVDDIAKRYPKALAAIKTAKDVETLEKYRETVENEMLEKLTVEQRKEVLVAISGRWEELQ